MGYILKVFGEPWGAFGMPRGTLEGPLAPPVRTFGALGVPVDASGVPFKSLQARLGDLGRSLGAFGETLAELELIWVSSFGIVSSQLGQGCAAGAAKDHMKYREWSAQV